MRMRLLNIVMLISFLLGFTYGNSIAGNQLTERQSLDILKILLLKKRQRIILNLQYMKNMVEFVQVIQIRLPWWTVSG
jgi:hypothetical protein